MNFLEISPYVFDTQLTWYSVFILIGAIVTYILSDYFYKKDPESKKCPDLMVNTLLIAFPLGLVGARIWYVFSEWDYYFNNPIEILKVWEGGLAIQGGVMLGVAAGVYYVYHMIKKHGMNLKVTRIMDFVIPNILIAQTIGRWGNFFNREVYGACVEKDVLWFLPESIREYMRGGYIADQYIACSRFEYAQPLFLYEGLLNLLGFVLISLVLRKFFKRRVEGTLSAFYVIWYGIVRACLEGLRNERFIMRWGDVSQSLLTSIFFVVAGVSFLIYLYLKNTPKEEVLETDKKDELNQNKEEVISIKEEVSEVKLENSKPKAVRKTVTKNSGATTRKTTNTTKTKSTTTTKKTTTKTASKKAPVKKTIKETDNG